MGKGVTVRIDPSRRGVRQGWELPVLAVLLGACSGGAMQSPDAAVPTFSVGEKPPAGAPANTVGGFGIQLPALTLPPGKEETPCYVLPLDLHGPSRWVGGAVLHPSPGMHHGNITTRTKKADEPDGVHECTDEENLGEIVDIAGGGTVLFGSSTQIDMDEWQHFPDGMAYRVPENQVIVAHMHYLNASTKPIAVTPSYEWYTVDEAKVTQPLAPFAWDYTKFTIPAHQTVTVTADCRFPGGAMHVVSVLPHMHKMGRRFTAGFLGGPLDGKLWMDSKGYDPGAGVLLQYDPAIDLDEDGVSFSCTWENPLDQDVHEGVGDNEMCILFGYAWPPESTYSILAGNDFCTATTAPGKP